VTEDQNAPNVLDMQEQSQVVTICHSKKMMQPTTMMLEKRHKHSGAELGHGAHDLNAS
jgi:hypothetical protein